MQEPRDDSRGARAPRAPVALAVARQHRRWVRQTTPSPARVRGRAWINGREVGGGDPRFDHLAVSYD
jgi:hypothetical protein